MWCFLMEGIGVLLSKIKEVLRVIVERRPELYPELRVCSSEGGKDVNNSEAGEVTLSDNRLRHGVRRRPARRKEEIPTKPRSRESQ